MAAPRLTPYQTDILVDVRRRAGGDGDRTVDGRDIRSKTAVQHLVNKGYLTLSGYYYGPRGGEYPYYTLTDLGRQRADFVLYRRRQKSLEFARKNADAIARGKAEIDTMRDVAAMAKQPYTDWREPKETP